MRNRRAFTLLELIIVTIIIGILVAVGVTRYSGILERARAGEALGVLGEIVSAEKRYFVENDSFTNTLTDLDIFMADPWSVNFTFSVPSTGSLAGYAQAARKCPAGGCGNRRSYGMCFFSSKPASCLANTCDPACP